ncbi:MAG TPA: alpha/beta hydrolase [Hydrogenophaga sp.]|nr:alpha/beta hydrolase [Hydrogenophaga sp.]
MIHIIGPRRAKADALTLVGDTVQLLHSIQESMIFNRILRRLLVLVSIVALAAGCGHLYQTRATAHDLKMHPAPGRMIDVNGLKYHLNCMGAGSPTVILEAGLGESSLSWYPVQSEIAKTTQVCAYDRAGLGWSEGGDQATTPEEVAINLRTLLKNAEVESPFILVGHSRGGIYARNFYHQFPTEVEGMVLVDSVHENGASREWPYAKWGYRKQKLQIAIAKPLSQIGVIRALGWANADKYPSPLPPDILQAKTAVQNRTATTHAVVNEITVMRQSLDPATPPPASLKNLPLTVLTSGKGTSVELARQKAINSNQSVENAIAIAQLEDEMQQELAALSSNSKHIVVENSGHFIMYDQPALVINAIGELVGAVRQ